LQWSFQQAPDGQWTIQDMESKSYLGYGDNETIAQLNGEFYGANLQAVNWPVYWNVTDAPPNLPAGFIQ
jgi:hypothetical protein